MINDPFVEALDDEIDTGYAETHLELLGDTPLDTDSVIKAYNRMTQCTHGGGRRSILDSSPNEFLDAALGGENKPLTPGEAFGFEDNSNDDDDTAYGHPPVE